MSIIVSNTGNKLVNTIASRNNLKKFKGMRVRVEDATGDPNLGSGSAEYIWNGLTWDTIWSSAKTTEWDDKPELDELGFVKLVDGSVKYENANIGVYALDVTRNTGAIDLEECQIAVIDATVNRTITFINPPASDKAVTVIIKLKGTGGVITWPAYIKWHNGTEPTLGTDYSVVTLLWDGEEWIGAQSMRN